VSRAREHRRPVLVSWTSSEQVDLDLVELWGVLRLGADRSFFWSSPWSGRQLVALGTVVDLQGRGTERFTEVHHAWSQMVQHAVTTSGSSPFLVGGFAFRPSDGASVSTGLPDALLWLPEAQLVYDRPGEPLRLTVNGLAHPDTDPDALATELASAALRLIAVREHRQHCDPEGPRRTSLRELPSGSAWQRLVAEAVQEIRQGAFEKVVLARRVDLETEDRFDLLRTVQHLMRTSPHTTVFAAELLESCFLGATPEYLLHVQGGDVRSVALAGSAPRGATTEEDLSLELGLLSSEKDRREHAIVVSRLVKVLEGSCDDVWLESRPGVLKLPHVQHLRTQLRASLGASGLLELMAAIHPTPALGGYPGPAALQWLKGHEGLDRGWYAAPIGWLDANGDGEFAVAIRSALVTGQTASLYTGCGVVADSVPAAEYAETEIKLQHMLRALQQS
jgi:isochorismate synthase